MGQAKLKAVKTAPLLKLDLGCGQNKREGFTGCDALKMNGVDVVHDLRKTPWPWKDNSVDDVHSSHFVEHLTGAERIPFFNELWRVMKFEAQAQIITPNWANERAYGDPTHQWPPMSAWYPLYLQAWWRKENAPHVGYNCSFYFQNGIGWDGNVMARNDEYKQFAATHYVNSVADLYVVLQKKPMDWDPRPANKA